MKKIGTRLHVMAALVFFFALRMFAQEMPRIMVVVDEKMDGKDVTARKVAGKIESALLAKGYRLVDKSQFESVRARDLELSDVNATKAKELGRRYGAELIIAGGAQAEFGGEREVYGIKTVEYTADGEVKVIITDTGEILAVSSASSRKASQGKSQAASKALEEVGDMLANDLLAKLEKKMQEQKEHPIVVQLALLGVNDASLMAIEESLPGRISMIQTMKLRYMEGDAAMFDVWIKGTLDDLRKQFSAMQDFAVTGVSGDRIDVNTKTKGIKTKVSNRLTSALEITEFKADNIFPASYNYYAYHPAGEITIENTGKSEIKNIKASVFIPTYMQLPSEQIIPVLKAKEKKSFPVSATLDEKQLMGVTDNMATQIKAEISYTIGGESKTRSITKPVTIYSKSSITWSKPKSVGAFITANDDAVKNFSRYVLGTVKYDQAILADAPRTLLNAMAVWEAIRAFGINYVSAPWRVAEADVLDDVQFPRETLANHTANCSGSSVLLSACLENIGIRTILVGTSDHVFIMFDTGVNQKNASRISLNDREYIIKNNSVWIPLETTLITHPFAEAWHVGADGYYKIADAKGRLDLIDVRTAWEEYPPANLARDVKVAEPPAADKIGALINDDLKNISQIDSKMLDEKAASLKANGDEKSAHQAALLLANNNRFDEALALLQTYSDAAALNNRGNIYLLKGDSLNAYKNYTAALSADAKDGGINLNMGLLQYLGGDHQGTVESFATAVSKFPSQEQAYAELGIDNIVAEMSGTRAAAKGAVIDKTELQSLLFAALKNIAANKNVQPAATRIRRGENRFVFGGRRGIDPTALSDIKDFLYWKI
ncbi:MAG: hypothetical protein KGJ59_09000 [Bacteroidota bacterium]|nr:hypothetical protein [Bacteroidota bacterium]